MNYELLMLAGASSCFLLVQRFDESYMRTVAKKIKPLSFVSDNNNSQFTIHNSSLLPAFILRGIHFYLRFEKGTRKITHQDPMRA